MLMYLKNRKRITGFLMAAFSVMLALSAPVKAYADAGQGAALRLADNSAVSAADEQKIDEWFNDTVFVGDSVMQGFSSYSARRSSTWLGRLKFLCVGSFSVYYGLHNGVQPMYQGKKVRVWDGLKSMKAKRVFIDLGLNDINMCPFSTCIANYKTFVGKIIENNPGIDVVIMSMTYTYPGVDNARINNNSIREYNALLQKMAAENGWGYLNLADALADENGDLRTAYCSDNYIHQNDTAYAIWCSTIRQYATDRLGIGEKVASGLSGTWIDTEDGRRFKCADGAYESAGWHWIDDNGDGSAECYYFNSSGILAVDTVTPDGYNVNSDGAWIENGDVKHVKVG